MEPAPSEIEQLVALAVGELDDDQSATLRARLESDPDLRARFDGLERAVRFLIAEPHTLPSPEAVKRAKRLLAESRPGALEQLADGLRRVFATLDLDTRLTPAVAGIRGAGSTAQIAFSADGADIDLELTRASDTIWRVLGQIDADEPGSWEVTIVERAEQRTIAGINAKDGAFQVELPSGSYLFQLRRDDLLIEAGPVQIP